MVAPCSERRCRVEAMISVFLLAFVFLSSSNHSGARMAVDAFQSNAVAASRIFPAKVCSGDRSQRFALFAAAGDNTSTEHPHTDVGMHNTGDNLSPVLRDIADERREFEMNLGKAMYVLRNDYPEMLVRSPDFSIYHDDIKVVDPSGVQFSGLSSYKNSFHFFRSVSGVFYNTDKMSSTIRHRMIYDFARSTIRISWNVVLQPKLSIHGANSDDLLHVDGISIYKLDRKSGKIVEHRVERVLMNNIPLRPPYGIFSALNHQMQQETPSGVLQPTPSI